MENVKKNLYPHAKHINATPEDIAPYVILCGDPLRAKNIADMYLENVKEVSSIRGMLYFTGTFLGVRITVGGHGMGAPSIAIYVHELYKFYNVKSIIRIGTCGAYSDKLKINDIINVDGAAGSCDFDQRLLHENREIVYSDRKIFDAIASCGKQLGYKVNNCNAYSEDLFYLERVSNWRSHVEKYNVSVVEMECYALFIIAEEFNAYAGSILTVVSSLFNPEMGELSSEQRSSGLGQSALLALNSYKHLDNLNKES